MRSFRSCTKPESIFALICALAVAPLAANAETWYWVGNNKKASDNYYYWDGYNNWTNANGVVGDPARGDNAVLNDNSRTTPRLVCNSNGDDTSSSSSRKALNSILITGDFKKGGNQGNYALIGGGEGLKVEPSGYNAANWTGILLEGEGEVPVDIVEANSTFYTQMRMVQRKDPDGKIGAVLVKKGLGTLVCFNQVGNRNYDISLTKIQQGRINVTTGKDLTNIGFRFDGNDSSARLQWGFNYKNNGVPLGILPLKLVSGAITESDDVANADHGLESDYDLQVQFTGTPSANPMKFSGKFYGGAGLLWSPSSSDYSFIYSNAVSSTTGHVEVAKGTLKLVTGASFTALSGLKVGADGIFEVEAGSGANFRAETLDVYTGSKLKLASGVTITVGAAALNALPVMAGTYTGSGAEGKSVAWIEGEGKLVVETGSAASFSWIGGGTDTGIATEGNWSPETPDLDSGDAFAVFADSGAAATLGRDASFAGLSLKNGFAFSGTGTLSVGDMGISALGAASAAIYSFGSPLEATANQTWTIGANNTFDVTGGLKGSGNVKVEGAGTLNIGSGAGYTGSIDIATGTTISGRNALGEAGAVARVRNDGNGAYFSNATNDAAVVVYSEGGLSDSNPIYFVGDNVFNGAFTNTACMFNMMNGATAEFTSAYRGNTLTMAGEGNVIFRSRLSQSGIFYMYTGNVTVDFYGENSDISGLFWSQLLSGRVNCHVPYAIKAKGWVDSSNTIRFQMQNGMTIDLMGNDQSVDGFYAKKGGTITSDEPAFFHWVAKSPYSATNDPEGNNMNRTNNVVFAGAAGLSYDGPQTNRLGGVSTTTGTLKVTDGKLIVLPHASWANCTNVVVSGGMLSVGNAAAFAENVVVDISGEGKVDLDYDGMAKCDRLIIDGQHMPGGEYGSDDSSAGHKLPNFSGTGVLTVKTRGLFLCFR